jgi:hypothetical protein
VLRKQQISKKKTLTILASCNPCALSAVNASSFSLLRARNTSHAMQSKTKRVEQRRNDEKCVRCQRIDIVLVGLREAKKKQTPAFGRLWTDARIMRVVPGVATALFADRVQHARYGQWRTQKEVGPLSGAQIEGSHRPLLVNNALHAAEEASNPSNLEVRATLALDSLEQPINNSVDV